MQRVSLVKNAGNKSIPKAKFQLGGLVITPGISDLIDNHGLDAIAYVGRHVTGDWSDMDEEDKASNEEALLHGLRVFSAYDLQDLPVKKLWVITEADRSLTTVLLPSEY